MALSGGNRNARCTTPTFKTNGRGQWKMTMDFRAIGKQIKANLPGVVRNTPYSTVVLLVIGFALGLWLAT